MKIHYVIAAYFGERRCGGAAYDSNRSALLDHQFIRLDRFARAIQRVTVVVNGAPVVPSCPWPARVAGAPVEWLYRDNVDGSYGAWNAAMVTAPDYDYHVCVEDDVLPATPAFDVALAAIMRRERLSAMWQHFTDHAACSSGIYYGADVARILSERGTLLPHDDGDHGYARLVRLQMAWHRTWVEHGAKVGSLSAYGHGFKFWTHDGRVILVGDTTRAIFEPAQLIGE